MKFKQLKSVIKKQEKARKVFEKNTNKAAKEIIKNNIKSDKDDSSF